MLAKKHTNNFVSIKSTDTLENLSQRLTLALTASNVGVWEYNLVNNTLVWDDQMYRHYGIAADTFSGAYEAWENGLHPDDLEQGRKDVQDAIAGVRKFDTSFRVIWPNGEIRNIRAIADVFYDDFGHATHMYGVNWDITEEIRLQEAMERTNRDLRHFSHIAAHDLREPCLRQRALSQMIVEDYANEISPELEKLLSLIDSQSSRMLEIIESFRALTNTGSQRLTSSQFKMQDAIETVIEELGEELKTIPVEIHVDANVEITGYIDLVHIMLRNLIINAIKYHGVDKKLRFFTEVLNGKLTFVIENSIDGEIKLENDLLHPFVRGTDEHDGKGIGLSICKRVMDFHGGSIWVESKNGKFHVKFSFKNAIDD